MSLSDFQDFSQLAATAATAFQEQSTSNPMPVATSSDLNPNFDPNNYNLGPKTNEEQIAFLKKYKVVVIYHCMKKESKTLVEAINHSLSEVMDESKNTIDITFGKTSFDGILTLDKVLHCVLHNHFKERRKNSEHKMIILVVADQVPSNKVATENIITHYINRINSKNIFSYRGSKKTLELGIRFFQVGHEAALTTYLHSIHHHLRENGAKIEMADDGNSLELTSSERVLKSLCKAIY